jgi:hypothetical protein
VVDFSVIRKYSSSPIFQLLRVVIYFLGFFTSFWFFYSFVGITIGLLYFLLHKDPSWKRHGIVLAFISSMTDIIAHRVPILPPLRMALVIAPSSLALYIIGLLAYRYWPESKRYPQFSISKLNQRLQTFPKKIKILFTLLLVLAPIVVWSSVNLDLEVLLDNEPRLLWVHVPTIVDLGSEFSITVEAWDAFERLSAIYKGTVQFSIESYNLTTFNPISITNADLPSEYTFTGQLFGSDIAYEIRDGNDNGLHVFTASINTPGIHYLLVEDSVTENTYYSNPIIVQDLSDIDSRIYWGDIHTHSELSDGTGSAAHSFYYARYIACLDVYALTDHGEIMMLGLGSFDVVESTANSAYDQGRFVTFQGVEWTDDETGHYTCIFSGDQLIKTPVVSYITLPTPDDLWNALDGFTEATNCRALALPHHTVQRSYLQDWTYVNPKYVKIAEVTSVHGECLFEQRHPLSYIGCIMPTPEYTNGTSIIDALRMGHRLTLYASSDEHDGHPGHSLSHTRAYIGHQRPWSVWHTRNEHPYPGSLVAIHATELTRDSVFAGLENQRVYANSDHGRPYLDFTINGTRVGDGSTFQVTDANAVREIYVTLAQDGAPAAGLRPNAASVTTNWIPNWNATIEIIKNGELLASIPVNNPVSKITVFDDSQIVGAVYGEQSCVQIDGQWYINSYSNNPIDPSLLHTGGVDFYIIRVVGENGRMTYAGPIWVEISS